MLIRQGTKQTQRLEHLFLVLTAVFLVTATVFLAFACGSKTASDPFGYLSVPPLFGISHAEKWNLDSLYRWDETLSDRERVQRLAEDLGELGAARYRPNLNWREVQPELAPTPSEPAELTESLIDAAAAGAAGSGFDWTVFDLLFDTLLDSSIVVLPVLGNSDDWRLPRLPGTEDAANPNAIGKDAYLLHLSFYARAAVRRYSNRIHVWQIENELNVAIFTTAVPTGRKGNAWADETFLERVILTLEEAVKAEDPRALVITNFHTDLPEVLHDWREALLAWSPYLDWIGLDVYPNYLKGVPVRGEDVAVRVRQARELIRDAKPVLVLETGYPSGPAGKGFSEAGQAEYMATASRAAVEAGARGFFVYTLVSPERPDEFGQGFQAVENYWGFFRADGSAKPAFATLQQAIRELEE